VRAIRMLAAFALALSFLAVSADKAEASCGDVWSQTVSQSSTMWGWFDGQSQAVTAYWSGEHVTPYYGTCQDINFRNNSRTPNYYPRGLGYYKDGSGRWNFGTRWWEDAPLGSWVVLVSSLPNGITYRVAGNISMSFTVKA